VLYSFFGEIIYPKRRSVSHNVSYNFLFKNYLYDAQPVPHSNPSFPWIFNNELKRQLIKAYLKAIKTLTALSQKNSIFVQLYRCQNNQFRAFKVSHKEA